MPLAHFFMIALITTGEKLSFFSNDTAWGQEPIRPPPGREDAATDDGGAYCFYFAFNNDNEGKGS